METVDWTIAGIGVVALVATVVGVVLYDDLAGDVDTTFTVAERDLGSLEGAVDSPASFQFLSGKNATAASFEVQIDFSGQAVQGGSATVNIEVTGPNDAMMTCTPSMTIAGQATSASETFTCALDAFTDVPADTTESNLPDAVTYSEGYTVRVSVTPPSDTTVPVIGAGASYSFSATVTGTESYYHATPVLPETETL